MLMQRLLSGGEESKLYSDEVFSAYLRTGTGADVTVTTGIDMTKGYMLWSKGRSGATDHAIYDSARGVTLDLASNTTAAQTTQSTGLKAVSATGHTIGSLAKMNTSAATYVDFVFRNAPKFFDVVTFTTNGSGVASVSHAIGDVPGMVVIKRTAGTDGIGWFTWHRSLTANHALLLNTTAASSNQGVAWCSPTASNVSFQALEASANYVAYLFANDTSADGIVQCGSFTTDGSGNATVTLGGEPQFLLHKNTVRARDWFMLDAARGWDMSATDKPLYANDSAAENAGMQQGNPTATGFQITGEWPSETYIYLAIRRPNKPPTSGTQVYNAIARTGTGAAATVTGVGFAPDLVVSKARQSGLQPVWHDRLRGAQLELRSGATDAETSYPDSVVSIGMDGVNLGIDASSQNVNYTPYTYINHFFRRAPGFFDVVCYTGTGVARTVPHSLGVAPELMIVKNRTASGTDWCTYSNAFGATKALFLNLNNSPSTNAAFWNNTASTPTVFTVGVSAGVNGSGNNQVSYLFATLPGISKIGNYTGNGSSQTINCGFTTGARFFLVKATSTTGSWWIFDSARGIVSAFDPALQLNSTAAEITSADAVDPDLSGIVVNQEATCSINASGISYVFLAIA